jgi:hypothetical protein
MFHATINERIRGRRELSTHTDLFLNLSKRLPEKAAIVCIVSQWQHQLFQ